MKRKKLRVTVLIIGVILIAGMAAMYAVSSAIYKDSFDYRCTTSAMDRYAMERFPSMTSSRHTFQTLQGHTLTGYLYKNVDDTNEKALIVFAHGHGAGGQNGYRPVFDYLIRSGYCVFAYDATGNDESEGEAVGGLPQGFIDMDYAVTYAQSLDEIRELPLILMGYSWGGLSAVNTLNTHPDAAAAVSLAGWNRSLDLIEYQGKQKVGGAAKLMIPFAALHEVFIYGKYAFSTAMKGFSASDCGVMIVHGELDDTVPIEYGYDTYAEKYADDPRFTFMRYEDRDHDILTLENGELDEELLEQIVAFCDGWVE